MLALPPHAHFRSHVFSFPRAAFLTYAPKCVLALKVPADLPAALAPSAYRHAEDPVTGRYDAAIAVSDGEGAAGGA